jgi:hypothetical protein
MLRLLALSLCCLVACRSGGSRTAPPSPSSTDAGAAQPPLTGSASSPPTKPESIAYQDVLVGDALPSGQIAQVGPPRWSHPGIAAQVAVTSDGSLVSASSSHVRLWDSTSGAMRWQVFTPAEKTSFALSRDGKAIAIAQGDFDAARVSIYEVGGPQRVSFESGPVTGLAFSPDGSKLAVASASVVIYQASDGKRLSGLKGYALAIGFSEDGALIVVGRDGIQRWNGTDATAAPVSAFSAPPSAAVVAPSSGVVAWVNGSSLQISTPKGSSIKIEAAATSPITALAISAKGDVVLVGWPGGIAAWDVGPTPTKRWQMETRFKSRPAIALDDAATTVGISDARGVFIAEASTGKELHTKEERLRFLGFAGDGNLLVARGQVYESVDLHTAALTPTRDLPEGAPAWVDSYVYGANGEATGWSSAAIAECAPLKIWVTGVGERSIRPPTGARARMEIRGCPDRASSWRTAANPPYGMWWRTSLEWTSRRAVARVWLSRFRQTDDG